MLQVAICKKLKNFTLDMTFHVGDEITVLFGPSGSGKTTVLNCIAGLTKPDKGKITLNNKILFQEDEKPFPIQSREIGYVFQDYALFPHMTVEKNIRYGIKDELLVDKLVDDVGIKDLMDQYPNHISGGEKQRVALVRALASKPDALLLDEPFSSLDGKTRNECQNELVRLHQLWKIPVILVTHDHAEAKKVGGQMLLIENGKLK